jgi:hypothetical protein
MPEVAKPFELRERTDDKLPYDPKAVRGGRPEAELKQEPGASAPAPEPNEPAASEAIQPELSTVPDAHEEQNVITHG